MDDKNKHNCTCSTCRWHWAPKGNDPYGHPYEHSVNYMACRRFAPRIETGRWSVWPITQMDDFCGEWEHVSDPENRKPGGGE